MTEEPENHTLALLQTMRKEMADRFNRLDERIDTIDVMVTELRQTQSAMLSLISSHDSHLMRIEGDLVTIKKRLNLADA